MNLLSLLINIFKKKSADTPLTEPVLSAEVTEKKVMESTEITEPKSYRQVDIIEHIKKTKPNELG
jgi:hypothetical protein